MIIIDGGYFYAAVILENNIVVRAAPILKRFMGSGRLGVLGYCRSRKWKIVYDEP